MVNLLPEYTTPAELADHLGVNERTIRDLARQLGACSKIGNRTILTKDNVDVIMEATRPCHSKSTNVAKSGTTREQFPEGDYAALQERLRSPSRKDTHRGSSAGHGNVISMGRGRA